MVFDITNEGTTAATLAFFGEKTATGVSIIVLFGEGESKGAGGGEAHAVSASLRCIGFFHGQQLMQ